MPAEGGAGSLSPAAETVRAHDPDRFFTALFAPPDKREALFLLYALNHELARARETVREPMMALIRLQWWHEVVEGAARRHELAAPLSAALERGALPRTELLAMIEAREAEAEPAIATLAAWRAYVEGSAGALAAAAGRALGATEGAIERLRAIGTAYGVAGQIRSVVPLARAGRCLLPLDLLGAHGLVREQAIAEPAGAVLRPVLDELAAVGAEALARGSGRLPRAVVAAALPGVFARRDLSRGSRTVTRRGLGDRLAVVLAAVTGRV